MSNDGNAISPVTRRDILDYLLLRSTPFHGRMDIVSFLRRVFDLSSMPSTDSRFRNAEGDIWQHMVNNDDWDNEYLMYTYLDLNRCDDQLFLSFLEQTLHPLVLSDAQLIGESVDMFNAMLAADGYSIQPSGSISGRPLFKSHKLSSGTYSFDSPVYELVLSYASEDRAYVETVAKCLRNNQVRVFFDVFEEVNLWGKDLVEHLDRVYRGRARYCVMFISEHYAAKNWTRHEWRSAFNKAVEDRTDYILPARFDDSVIPGLNPSLVYVDLRKKTPDELCTMILSKLGRANAGPTRI